MTMMGLDIERIELLDYAYAPPCDWNTYSKIKPQCDVTAEWKLVLSCCGTLLLMCSPHKVEQLLRMEVYAACGDTVAHFEELGGCGAQDVKFVVVERL